MAGVFISYRREDSPGHAGRIFDRVRARFGADVVFMDVTAIDAGVDFVDAIDRAVGTCDVLLAVIGPHWAGATDSAGRRRLDNPNDFIRLEIGGALKRNVRVVPVLVDDAQLPGTADLPDDLQPLLRRNAVQLRDARWDADIEQLVASLERIVRPPEEPLRLEASPRGRLRWAAAIAVLALGAGAAAVLGPRGCAPPARSVATTVPTTTAPAPAGPRASSAAPVVPSPSPATPPAPRAESPSREPKSAPAGRNDAPKEPAPIPDVVGRQLSEAREILRRAGVEVARVLYRDDRTKAEDLVVVQSDAKTSAGSPPAVALTAIARAAVVIRHKPEDADMARGLLGALTSSPAFQGLALRTAETSVVRADAISRVTYSDEALAATAADLAKDATAWLRQHEPERPALTAARYPPVVSRTIVIGVPDRGRTSSSSSSAPLPDVRGLGLADARRTLMAAGVTAFAYKWSDDAGKKAFEVFGQSELKGRAEGRTVLLLAYAKGTLWLYRTDKSSPLADRFARELQSHMDPYGIVLHIVRQPTVRPEFLGKVESGDTLLSREARTIAAFASNWLAKETGRPARIAGITGAGGDPRRLTFQLPPLD